MSSFMRDRPHMSCVCQRIIRGLVSGSLCLCHGVRAVFEVLDKSRYRPSAIAVVWIGPASLQRHPIISARGFATACHERLITCQGSSHRRSRGTYWQGLGPSNLTIGIGVIGCRVDRCNFIAFLCARVIGKVAIACPHIGLLPPERRTLCSGVIFLRQSRGLVSDARWTRWKSIGRVDVALAVRRRARFRSERLCRAVGCVHGGRVSKLGSEAG